jgi:hypothetical protein
VKTHPRSRLRNSANPRLLASVLTLNEVLLKIERSSLTKVEPSVLCVLFRGWNGVREGPVIGHKARSSSPFQGVRLRITGIVAALCEPLSSKTCRPASLGYDSTVVAACAPGAACILLLANVACTRPLIGVLVAPMNQ